MIAVLIADRLGHRNAGFAILGFAAVLLLIAVLVGWRAVQRWRAAAALEEWTVEAMAGDRSRARAAAERAVGARPASAATALAAADLTTAGGADDLARALTRCEVRHRPLVETALALSQALRKHEVTYSVEGADAELVRAIAALAHDRPVTPPTSTEAASGAVVRAATQRLARDAWRRGDAEAIRRAFAALVLHRPQHAEARRIALVVGALHPDCAPQQLGQLAQRVGEDAGTLLRACRRLAPERDAAIAQATPAQSRSPEDQRRLLLASTEPIERLAEQAKADPLAAEVIAWRALDAGRPDLAEQLAQRLPATGRGDLSMAIAMARGDLAALAKLDPARADLAPRVSPPAQGPGVVAFHLATAAGLVPTATPTVTIGGETVPAARIARWDSLVSVPHVGGEMAIEIALDGSPVWSGRVAP